tara:strand:- start:330 stop:527 length:198 start_codon:yes stop_codon:yes gene_type:complete
MRNESCRNALIERYKNFTNDELSDLHDALLESNRCCPTVMNMIEEIEDVFELRADRSVEMEEQGE